jgi:hypothetical protein
LGLYKPLVNPGARPPLPGCPVAEAVGPADPVDADRELVFRRDRRGGGQQLQPALAGHGERLSLRAVLVERGEVVGDPHGIRSGGVDPHQVLPGAADRFDLLNYLPAPTVEE